jgi:hypothetical protein
MLGSSRVAAQLAASQEGLSSMQLIPLAVPQVFSFLLVSFQNSWNHISVLCQAQSDNPEILEET